MADKRPVRGKKPGPKSKTKATAAPTTTTTTTTVATTAKVGGKTAAATKTTTAPTAGGSKPAATVPTSSGQTGTKAVAGPSGSRPKKTAKHPNLPPALPTAPTPGTSGVVTKKTKVTKVSATEETSTTGFNLPADMPSSFIETMKKYGLYQVRPGRFELGGEVAGDQQAAVDPGLGPSVRDLMAAQGEREIPDLAKEAGGATGGSPLYRPEHMSPREQPTYGPDDPEGASPIPWQHEKEAAAAPDEPNVAEQPPPAACVMVREERRAETAVQQEIRELQVSGDIPPPAAAKELPAVPEEPEEDVAAGDDDEEEEVEVPEDEPPAEVEEEEGDEAEEEQEEEEAGEAEEEEEEEEVAEPEEEQLEEEEEEENLGKLLIDLGKPGKGEKSKPAKKASESVDPDADTVPPEEEEEIINVSSGSEGDEEDVGNVALLDIDVDDPKLIAEAKKTAEAIAKVPADKPAQKSKAAAEKEARDAEAELLERAGIPQVADDEHALTDGERMLAAQEYKGLSERAMLERNTGWTKQAAGSCMVHTRQMNAIRSVQAAHSKILRDVMDTLKAVQRQLKALESVPRMVALERYVLKTCPFTVNGFVLAMIRLICSNDYRIEYAYPVDQYYEQLVYIPDRLKRFIIATAQTAADHAKAYLPLKQIDKQARIAFQASQVRREINKQEMHKAPEKRRKPLDPEHPFTSSSEEEDKEGKPKAKKSKKDRKGKAGQGKKGKKSEEQKE